MNIDWSKYPSLPEPPKLPEWRDTPEHEAYWKEISEIKTPADKKGGCMIALMFWLVPTVIPLFFVREYDLWTIAGFGVFSLMFTWIFWYIFCWICFGVEKHRISKRYGFSLRNLNRPDLSREIGGVLSRRPDFDKAEFRKYWQNKELAKDASKILEIAKGNWVLHRKMLYPNDPLLLLFYGKEWFWGKEKMITSSGEFYEDMADEFYFYDIESVDNDMTLAELVERCQKARIEAE